MATSWNSADVMCPFYKSDDGVRIVCENLLQKSKNVTHRFESSSEKQRHMKRCCCGHYKRCLYYRVLLEKYESAER